MNIKEALKWGQDLLARADVSEPRSSAEVLLADVLGIPRDRLLTSDLVLDDVQESKYKGYIQRRKEHEPVWQIIGKVDFWGMQYTVTKDVLVPRPETELLVREVLSYLKDKKMGGGRILDLGCGSGTIAIALACELPNFSVFASDVSSAALGVARQNAKKLVGSSNIVFQEGNLLDPWKDEKFDIICANLPYIPHEDMESLQFDVLHHEPRVALDGGREGLEIYEELFATVSTNLATDGAIFCEIGVGQGEGLQKLVARYLPGHRCEILGDLAGIDRIAIIKK